MIKIGDKAIGEGYPTYVIAEAGVNHNNNVARAKELVVQAANAGADAIKFQTYSADKLVTRNAPRFWNWQGEANPGGTQFDSYSLLDKLPLAAYYEIAETCRANNIEFISTPFDEESAEFLVRKVGMKAIKVSSSDVSNIPFLEKLSNYQIPIIMATGASTMGEIEEAVSAITNQGNTQIILLHCTLCYPTAPKDANLRVMDTLQAVFPHCPVGLSDHTMGITVPIAAVARGAKAIEKHYTVDKTLDKSADHWLSVDPAELAEMVGAIRIVEAALGSSEKIILEAERETRVYDKRSIVAVQKIAKGSEIESSMVTAKRPGTGIPPKYRNLVIGRIAQREIPSDTVINWGDI